MPCVFAFWIVRAADKGTKSAKLQPETAIAASRTDAGIGYLVGLWKHVWTEDLVELGDNGRDFQIFGLADGGGKALPEVSEQLLPRQIARCDFVELFLQISSESVFDITSEETRKEGGDNAALVFGNEAVAIHAHIGAVAQDRQNGCVSRRPAYSELFQLPHDARFGVAGWRLSEMLGRTDLRDVGAVSCGDFRQPRTFFIV